MRRAHLERARVSHALLLTRKTVERHVSNILAKLEVKNRAQLAAAVATADGGR
jgi:DNA-binding NarL/FixJ family response regulator